MLKDLRFDWATCFNSCFYIYLHTTFNCFFFFFFFSFAFVVIFLGYTFLSRSGFVGSFLKVFSLGS